MDAAEPYNPLSKINLGESVAEALLRVGVKPLSQTEHLLGAGIYAIYYIGDLPIYRVLKERNADERFQQPIYVGKAVPEGSRKGGLGFDAGAGRALRDRLRIHATSLDQADNLRLEDFGYRALTVDDIWIPLGENVVIQKFQPLWNRVIDGFGNKDPGNRRATQYRSPWDVLHPGRVFAEKLAVPPFSREQLERRILDFFRGELPEADKLAPGGEEQGDEV